MIAILVIDKIHFQLLPIFGTCHTWSHDQVWMEPGLNSARTGMEPWLNWHGTQIELIRFHLGSMTVQSGFQASSIWVQSEFNPGSSHTKAGEMGIKSSPVPFEANGESITLQLDYNWPAMDSPGSRLEMCAQFLSVPCMLGTKFFWDMRGLRKHTRPKQSLTLEGHYKWVK